MRGGAVSISVTAGRTDVDWSAGPGAVRVVVSVCVTLVIGTGREPSGAPNTGTTGRERCCYISYWYLDP